MCCFLAGGAVLRALHSFPTRRSSDLGEVLGTDRGTRAVRQLRRFRDLQELDLPVILLVGGGTGTGKSTVATEVAYRLRSEEHTSELQSQSNLVCRLLLEKKKKRRTQS